MQLYLDQTYHLSNFSHWQFHELFDSDAEIFSHGDVGVVLLQGNPGSFVYGDSESVNAQVDIFCDYGLSYFINLIFFELPLKTLGSLAEHCALNDS